MKHIIWVTPGFAADEHDSRCIPPQQLLAKTLLEEDGLKLHIVSLHYPHRENPYSWNGADVHPCFSTGFLAKTFILFKAFKTIRQLLQEHPNAVLHSFWLNDACLVAHLANHQAKRKHLVTLMGQDARPTNRYLKLLPLKKLYKVALSQFHQQQFTQTTGETTEQVIPWGLKPLPFPFAHRSYHLIGIGNLIPLKRFHWWIELVASLKNDIPDITTVLIGDGPERAKLEKMIKDAQLEQNIKLMGSIPRNQVMTYLRKSQVLVHSSSYESYGFVLLEALQQGTQVVSTPVGIAPELPNIHLAQDLESFKKTTLQALQKTEQEVHLPEGFTLAKTRTAYLALYERFSSIKP